MGFCTGEVHAGHIARAISRLRTDDRLGAVLQPDGTSLADLSASVLASVTGDARHWANAAAAATGLLRYFDTPMAGLWYDRLSAEGTFQFGPAPASSFYHIVASAVALTQALAEADAEAGT